MGRPVVIAACRTAIGKFQGVLAPLTAPQLGVVGLPKGLSAHPRAAREGIDGDRTLKLPPLLAPAARSRGEIPVPGRPMNTQPPSELPADLERIQRHHQLDLTIKLVALEHS